MSQPTFFTEGSTPRANDAQWRILQKILGATIDGGGGSSSSGIYGGIGDPNGVTTATGPAIYIQGNGAMWVKPDGITGNSGWLSHEPQVVSLLGPDPNVDGVFEDFDHAKPAIAYADDPAIQMWIWSVANETWYPLAT